MSMLILSRMLTQIRVYIFKTFQPEFQLIKQPQMGRRACVIDDGLMVFKIMRFWIIFCITLCLSDHILAVTS